jgi:nitrile hydratase subunit alpha
VDDHGEGPGSEVLGTAPGHTHIHEPEAHVAAVETDFEYFRRKRLESRVLHFLRRGIITFADLLRADAELQGPGWHERVWPDADGPIRYVEDELDRLVRGIAAVTVPHTGAAPVAIDDTRKERGDYDEFFRIATRGLGQGTLEERLAALEAELRDAHRLLDAFTGALLSRGRVTEEQIRLRREQLETVSHHNGARIVARAWLDPEFKERLLATGRAAVRELDIPPGKLGRLGVAENTDEVHNIVVCTLCSCYPHDLLGNPAWWYRTDEYKERIVAEPRKTIRDMFGLDLPEQVKVRVHDSTSDVRWMVIPQRPAGTEGLDEDSLAALVTSDSLVGAAVIEPPHAQG